MQGIQLEDQLEKSRDGAEKTRPDEYSILSITHTVHTTIPITLCRHHLDHADGLNGLLQQRHLLILDCKLFLEQFVIESRQDVSRSEGEEQSGEADEPRIAYCQSSWIRHTV